MATYYVRKTGNDANSGLSAGLAKLTIQAAVNIATTAGDTVYVGAGSYREIVTLAASGSGGSPISIIGDYAGTQTGDAGIVRITGSDNDQSATRAQCIVATGKSFIVVRGFTFDMATAGLVKFTESGGADFSDITVDQCSFQGNGATVACILIQNNTAAKKFSNVAITNCLFFGSRDHGVRFDVATENNTAATTITNCVFVGQGGRGIYCGNAGGITVRNCTFMSTGYGGFDLPGTGTATATVTNCLFMYCAISTSAAIRAQTAATITEDYNTFWGNASNRSAVSTGANSATRPPLCDMRWFHALVGGGSIASAFDMASYSSLVELNSGTGAPSTDMRGASQTGSYREWGPLEYNSALSISGGSALGLPIVGSAIVRGDA